MGLNFEYNYGNTPLEEEEIDCLIIRSISTHEELNEFEQHNIEEAIEWFYSRTLNAKTVFTEGFVRNLHKRMFGNVWQWAGEFRKTDKNLGIDKWQITTSLKALLEDTLFWMEQKTFGADEIALRFKHRLVSIHCFPNGNGRHSRLMADLISEKIFKQPVFSWGKNNPSKTFEARAEYLKAVKAADLGDYQPLLFFARM